MHLDDGQLRAALDHELEPSAAEHLAGCSRCSRRADEMGQQAQRVTAHLAALESSSSSVIPSTFATLSVNSASDEARPRNPSSGAEIASPLRLPTETRTLLAMTPYAALARFKIRYSGKESPRMKKIFSRRYRAAWAMVAVAALLAVFMTFPPVRAWAEGMLAQFRASKISVVSVDSDLLSQLGNGSDLSKQISQVLADSVTVTKKPQGVKTAANAADASKLAGFQVRLPTSRSDAPRLTVQDSGAFQLVVNRARAQSLLDQAGASNLKLPTTIDGAVIKVTIPSGVVAGYGDCPNLGDEADAANSKGSPGRTMIDCTVLTQIPSPSVDAPPDLDIQQLAELGLQFAGMTKDQAHAYASSVEWTSTLVVPIPRNAAQYKAVLVDGGASGYLIQRPLDDSPQYAIIWVKNGIIYAVSGIGGDTTAALNLANSLK